MNYSNYVAQVDESDCGVAALAMIFKHFGSNYSIAKLRDLARTTKQGTTALGLVKAANQLGLKATAIQTDLSYLTDEQTEFPFIVHVVKKNLLHYYVVYKADKNYVYIADPDPSVKAKKMTIKKFSQQWSGICLLFSPLQSYVPQKKKLSGLIVSFKQLINCKKLIASIVFSAIIITFVSIIGSYYLQVIIDTFIPNKSISLLTIVTLTLIVIYAINSLFSYTRDYFLTRLDQKLSAQISLSYIKHVYNLPMRFFSTRKTGEITSRFNDINKIIDAISSTVISIFLDIGMMIIIGFFLFRDNSFLFGITLLSLPLFSIVMYLFNKKFAKLDEEQMESNAIVSSSIIEDLKGIETLKILRLEQNRFSKITNQFSDFLQKNLSYAKTQALQEALKLWLQYSLTTVILFEGARLVINGQISLGMLMAYNTLLAFFISPLQNIISLQTKLQEARVANHRLNEISEISTEKSLNRNIKLKDLDGDICFNHLSYSYGYSNSTLKNINLTIKDNSNLAIVGLSGSGKSTLAKLIAGFYQPTSGNLVFNNKNINALDPKSIRQYVHYLPQTPHLFSGTIRENLLLGLNRQVSQEELDTVCKKAMIYNDIQKMPLKYETRLDEEASSLSGGQKQRLTIARALLSTAHVLIFDESTSSLDPITESKIVSNILKIKNKTIIFIAHRLSIAKKVNNIIVLKDGKIVENDNHNNLLKNKKYYYDLWTA